MHSRGVEERVRAVWKEISESVDSLIAFGGGTKEIEGTWSSCCALERVHVLGDLVENCAIILEREELIGNLTAHKVCRETTP